jgi:geranylgeranyl diphosphate synthase type II
VFGEAMAILTGDALLTEAFGWLSKPIAGVDAPRQLLAIREVVHGIDSTGMIGGQVADIVAERSQHDGGRDAAALLDELQFIHANKTGRLLTASVLLGGLLGGADDRQLAALREYGRATGLAFQIVDDLLDIEETAESLGKTAGKDVAQGKLTYPALVGIEPARAKAAELLEIAVRSADIIAGPGLNYLAQIARYVCERRS